MSNRTTFEWVPRNLTIDEAITFYVNTPLCILGAILCLVTGLALSSDEFKDKTFSYFNIECFLMTADLLIVAFRSGSSIFMCLHQHLSCPQLNRLETVLKVVVFFYLPSPIEASVLVANIFAIASRLVQLNPRNRRGFILHVMNAKPHRVIFVSFAFFSLIFSHQLLSDPDVFHVEFFHKHQKKFNIMTFAFRDGLLLAILIFFNIKIWLRVKESMRKKVNIMGVCVRQRAKRAKSRMNVIILSVCVTTTIGRLPIFFYILTRSIYPSFSIPGLLPICITSIFLSYASKFFIFFFVNVKFRNVLLKKICFRKYFPV